MKLYNSLRAVILEVANRDEVLNAIKIKKLRLYITKVIPLIILGGEQ